VEPFDLTGLVFPNPGVSLLRRLLCVLCVPRLSWKWTLTLRTLLLLSFCLTLPARGWAQEDPVTPPNPIEEALGRGDYEQVLARLQRWATRPEAPPEARARLVDVYLTMGRYDEAQRLCEKWLKETPEDAWALTSRAQLALVRGESALAESLCRKALAGSRGMLPARIELVAALLAQGHWREAVEEAGFFPQRLTALIDPDSRRVGEEVSVNVLLDLARGCALYGLAAHEPAALKLAVQDLYPEARRRDPGQVRGYVEPAALLLAKHNVKEARQLYEQALEVNPNYPEAHLGLARCYWQAGERDEARSQAEQALATNPHHPQAHALLSRIDLADTRLVSARQHVRDALATNPYLGEARALDLVLRLVSGGLPENLPGELTDLPPPAQAQVYRELGRWLSDHRRYAEAELQYQRGLLVAPQDPETTAGLGLCYFRWGREDQARKTLDAAFALDSFNVRVYNALEVLDFLSGCKERRGRLLVVRSAEQEDLLAGYVATLGADALGRLLEQFGVEAQKVVVVELLPTLDLFSARVTGLPGLGINGACLGRVVALLSPSAAERPFNWYDTLVHELTHAACYLAAGGRLPQWMEEGLALWAEGTARPRSWNLILLHARDSGGLLSLAELDRDFLAEPGSAERTLAYAQSALAVEFLVERMGWERLRSLLPSAKGPGQWLESVAGALKVDGGEEVEALYREFLEARCTELRARMALANSLAREWKKGEPLSQASAAAVAHLLDGEPGAFELAVVREFAAEASDPAVIESAARGLVALERTDVGSALALADGLRAAGRPVEAEQVYRVALGADVAEPRVHVGLAVLALAAERREEAAREAGLAWGELSDRGGSLGATQRGRAWKGLAAVFAALGDEKRAEQSGLRARALLRAVGAGDEAGGSP